MCISLKHFKKSRMHCAINFRKLTWTKYSAYKILWLVSLQIHQNLNTLHQFSKKYIASNQTTHRLQTVPSYPCGTRALFVTPALALGLWDPESMFVEYLVNRWRYNRHFSDVYWHTCPLHDDTDYLTTCHCLDVTCDVKRVTVWRNTSKQLAWR